MRILAWWRVVCGPPSTDGMFADMAVMVQKISALTLRVIRSLTSSLRVFILDYFHTSSTEDGHRSPGHGQGMFLSQQQDRLDRKRPEGLARSPQRTRPGPGVL